MELTLFQPGGLLALAQVLMIDVVLAGDNAVVIGLAAARVPAVMRKKVIFWGLVADLSMSLDNVLAVAGAARDHLDVLIIGLLMSVGLMGAAANFIARLLERYRWIAYIGLAIVVYVALSMIYHGWAEVAKVIG